MAPQVLIIDDDQTFAADVERVFRQHAIGIEAANTREAAIEKLSRAPGQFDIILLDLILVRPSGAVDRGEYLLPLLDSLDPPAKVVVISDHLEDLQPVAFRSQILSVPKGAGPEVLAKVVAELRGSNRIKDALENFSRVKGLTKREAEILDLGVQGLSGREIAEKLQRSARTIDVFWYRLMQKTSARTRGAVISEFLKFALRER